MRLCDARILFVDDEPLLLEIFARWLAGDEPKRISTAADGVEALEMLTDNEYDLVITDVNMPRMTGVELVRHKGEWKKQAPSIVFVSGFGNVDEREMYGLGVQAFLSKPTARETFIATAERALADRWELWQTQSEAPPRHSLLLQARDFSDSADENGIVLGLGGFNAPYARTAALGKVNFDCHISARDLRLTGQGYVRWISQAEGRIGIELAFLEEGCRAAIFEEMNRNASQAFIPSR